MAEIQGLTVVLANAYAPNIEDPSFFGLLECRLSEMGDYPLIMGGDFYPVWCFVSKPEHSLPALIKILDTFSHLSGYKVNWMKSKALPLTLHCQRTTFQRGNFSWPINGIKSLGVIIPPKLADLIKVNIEPALNQFEADIERWAPLFLSLWGKANVLKMTCVPKFNYILQALPVRIPLKYFKQFDKLCTDFSGKPSAPGLIYIN